MKVRVQKMTGLIIFSAMMGLIGIASVIATISDYIDNINHKRKRSKMRFVQTHIGYGLDKDGNIVKIK
jgi:hypothetical protein